MSLAAGQSLTFNETLGPLRAGGMGEVYCAKDTRLEREAKALASLSHPIVASSFGIDQGGDACFLAMELAPGEDLSERMKRGPLPVDCCRQIAERLEVAHEAALAVFVLVAPGKVSSVLMGIWDGIASHSVRRAIGAFNIAFGVGIGWVALVAF